MRNPTLHNVLLAYHPETKLLHEVVFTKRPGKEGQDWGGDGDVMAKPSKYRNKWTVVDGIKFQSKREAARYTELKLLEKAGEIYYLELQPKFPCFIGNTKICTYVADFKYDDYRPSEIGPPTFHIEDVKGVRTPVYRLKKKLVEALYDVVIEEV